MPKFQIFKHINSNNIIIFPYKSHADYEVSHDNYKDEDIVLLQGKYTSTIYKNDILPIDSILLSPNEPKTKDGEYYKRIIHDHLRTFFYNLDSYLNRSNNIKLFLYETANVISIPHYSMGENINEGSVNIEYYINQTTSSLQDDEKGNLIDNSINTSSFVNPSNNIAYIGFEDKYNLKKYSKLQSGKIYEKNGYIFSYDTLNFKKEGIGLFRNLNFSNGIVLKNPPSSSGTKALFNGDNSFVKLKNVSLKDIKNFAISFWSDIPNFQSDLNNNENVLISKRYGGQQLYFNKKDSKYKYKKADEVNKKYPYEIGIFNSNSPDEGKLYFKKSDGQFITELTSSLSVTGSQHHFLLQRSGSKIQLFLDGALDSETTDSFSFNNENENDIYVGTLDESNKMFSGSLDEIRFFNKSLSSNEIVSLVDNDFYTGSLYQTNVFGNVFYNEGLITITSPSPKYNQIFSDSSRFKIQYQSTLTHYENNIICKVGKSEFNNSFNPTLRINNTEDSNELKGFVTSSNFHNYITQIGLYDKYGRLLVIAKLPYPVQKRSDIDLNFLIKFDT